MPSAAASMHRSSDIPLVAGVGLRLGRRLGIDPWWVRGGFVAATLLGGFGIPVYVIAWLLLPEEHGVGRRLRTGRAAVEVALGAGLLVAALLLTLRATGFWFSDALTFPAVLVAAGGALIWRTSQSAPPSSPEATTASPRARPQTAERAAELVRERTGWAASLVSRTGVGIALVIAAALVFLQATGALGAARDVALAAIVVVVAVAVIFAPWILRLVRSLDAERSERIRSQERAEVAAHLHDSVLQTLALVQKQAEDPAQVAALARSQERELRAWLSGRRQSASERRLHAALEAVASEIEHAHGAEVDVVAVGDADLDERGEALVAAAREAMLNAARHGGGTVSVYVEAGDGRATVFVRDRGPGFDLAQVPADRRGISESIVGRMQRHGGRATVHSTPGEGTEVELSL
jgi:signal transduction histidine kinase/phage shock protein PspC (stress-responsive transcriptional regulator)